MAEPIFKRMQRIVSAGFESATDAAERLNGNGLMRHAIREVDQAIDGVKKRLDAAKAQALQADWRQAEVRDRAAALASDARFAVDKGRDDLARVAVAHQLSARLDELRERKAQMERDYAILQGVKREAAAAAGDPKTLRKVERAEAAFERARLAAGIASSAAGAPAQAAADEIKAARQEDEIAARLAAMRGGAEPGKPKAGGRRKG